MIRVADYVMNFIGEHQDTAKDIFLVSGGGMMHLLDAVGRCPKLNYICNHHEQACAIAAEGYARISGKIGVTLLTTGPGGTNAITGIAGAWLDSMPMLAISGQVKTSTTISVQPGLRQLGDQELNVVDVVKPITKYAFMVTDKNSIRYHLEKAVYLAKNGRPGPVWLDIPLDVQAAMVEESELQGFDHEELGAFFDKEQADAQTKQLINVLKSAKRPAFIVGSGVFSAGAHDRFIQLAEKLNIPVLTSISGIDSISSDHPLFFGRPGILGERKGNFIMQNSDALVVMGTRMGIRIIGYDYETVAREATKIMIDIDAEELNKPTFKPDIKIHADAGYVIDKLLEDAEPTDLTEWINYCRKMREKYPVTTEEHRQITGYVSSFYLPEVLSDLLANDAVIVTGNGTAYTSTFQTIQLKHGQRMFANEACAAMGYDLPAAIGACFATDKKDVICITGDGSIQMNLQELQTIVHYKLPIKIIMYNNDGYVSIKNTQKSFFDSNFVGSDPSSGVSIPNMMKIADVYGIPSVKISSHCELREQLSKVLNTPGPVFCEVMLDPLEAIYPKAFSIKKPDGTMVSKPLEDLYPFLPRKEFLENMLIEPVNDGI